MRYTSNICRKIIIMTWHTLVTYGNSETSFVAPVYGPCVTTGSKLPVAPDSRFCEAAYSRSVWSFPGSWVVLGTCQQGDRKRPNTTNPSGPRPHAHKAASSDQVPKSWSVLIPQDRISVFLSSDVLCPERMNWIITLLKKVESFISAPITAIFICPRFSPFLWLIPYIVDR